MKSEKKLFFFLLAALLMLACGQTVQTTQGRTEYKKSVLPTITVQNTAQQTVQTPRRAVVVNSGGLNVRVCSSTSCGLAAPLPLVDGTNVVLTGEVRYTGGGVWVKISSPVSGWVNRRYLSEDK